MKRILAILATSVVVMLSVVGCGDQAAINNVPADKNKNSIWDYTTDIDSDKVLNYDGSLTFDEVKINGMDCIIIEQSTYSSYNIIAFDCDWTTKEG